MADIRPINGASNGEEDRKYNADWGSMVFYGFRAEGLGSRA